MIRRLLLLLTLLLGLLVVAGPAMAHPLGNFTTNTSAALLPGEETLAVHYVLDLAEVPTQQARSSLDGAGGPQVWARQECEAVAAAQTVQADGAALPLSVTAVGITFPPGEAGLDTLRLQCQLSGPLDATSLSYTDGYAPDRLGWREVIAAGDGVGLASSDVPTNSASDQLRDYPDAEVSSVTSAVLELDPAADGDPDAVAALTRPDTDLVTADAEETGWLEGIVASYTDLVARQDLTVGFVALAILVAVVLGTAHAVAPGHGKTVIAAYLLGEGGHARQAVALGGTVAITHTIGVLALGVLVSTSTALAPERLYPVLGAVGGVLFTLLGVGLLVRALRRRGHSHAHGHHHGHHAHPQPHRADAPAGDADYAPPPGWKSLVLPGLAGGMVPSPSALLVLLGGIAIGRAWFGVVLVLAYGVGMALALVGAGYLLHHARARLADWLDGPRWARISGALPVATSSLIVAGGLVIVARSLLFA